jgi:hypothetical protein
MADPQDIVVLAAAPVEAPAVAGNPAHVKLAGFWPQNLALWFAQVEFQFQVMGWLGSSTASGFSIAPSGSCGSGWEQTLALSADIANSA